MSKKTVISTIYSNTEHKSRLTLPQGQILLERLVHMPKKKKGNPKKGAARNTFDLSCAPDDVFNPSVFAELESLRTTYEKRVFRCGHRVL
jgi:hypothetical protein